MKQSLNLLHEGIVSEPFNECAPGLLALVLLLIGNGAALNVAHFELHHAMAAEIGGKCVRKKLAPGFGRECRDSKAQLDMASGELENLRRCGEVSKRPRQLCSCNDRPPVERRFTVVRIRTALGNLRSVLNWRRVLPKEGYRR